MMLPTLATWCLFILFAAGIAWLVQRVMGTYVPPDNYPPPVIGPPPPAPHEIHKAEDIMRRDWLKRGDLTGEEIEDLLGEDDD